MLLEYTGGTELERRSLLGLASKLTQLKLAAVPPFLLLIVLKHKDQRPGGRAPLWATRPWGRVVRAAVAGQDTDDDDDDDDDGARARGAARRRGGAADR